MADPQAATLNQLRNIQARTGKTIAELHTAVAASGLAKHGDRRSWLMEQYTLGYGDANAIVNFMGTALPVLDGGAPLAPAVASAGNPLAAIYSGTKAGLLPLHDAVLKIVQGYGEFEQAPKKSYVSLRRNKQFAMLGPATQTAVEIGINVKGLPAHPRLKVLPPGGMCPVSTRISKVAEVDAELGAWLKQAYEAAG